MAPGCLPGDVFQTRADQGPAGEIISLECLGVPPVEVGGSGWGESGSPCSN